MTTLKKEKNEVEYENKALREKLDDLYYLNQKLDEALRMANDKIHKLENNT